MNRPMMRLTTAVTSPFLLCTWILAGISSMSAFAHPLGINFSTATDLGATTSWTDGRTNIAGRLTDPGDENFFQFRVSSRVPVQMWTTGAVPNSGTLYDSDQVQIAVHDSSARRNFQIARTLDPGTYYIKVGENRYHSGTGYRTGPYTLHLDTDAEAGIIPMFPAASRSNLQGFARVVNHSDEEASVRITAVDDAGVRHSPTQELSLSPWQAVHFNSQDLETGNTSKGIVGVGSGTGDWYLEVTPESPGIRTLGYIRTTSDGFLASMNTVAPRSDNHRVNWIATFNPGSNRNQVSMLRLIHPRCPQSECETANVSIVGVDDAGRRSGRVTLALRPGQARMVTAQQLEQGDDAFQGEGAGIGDGIGKWRLLVTADQPIQVMSLLRSPTGHLVNLSPSAEPHGYTIP